MLPPMIRLAPYRRFSVSGESLMSMAFIRPYRSSSVFIGVHRWLVFFFFSGPRIGGSVGLGEALGAQVEVVGEGPADGRGRSRFGFLAGFPQAPEGPGGGQQKDDR